MPSGTTSSENAYAPYDPADECIFKKMANHAHAMALHFLYYNFVRIHKTLKTTPAMAAGVTDRLWEVVDMVKVLEAWEATN